MSSTEKYVSCSICGEPIDVQSEEYSQQSSDVAHIKCEEYNSPPPVLNMTFDPARPHTDNIYNCGHIIYGPHRVVPLRCPKCDMPLL